jgi:hypothetical protein
MNESNHMDLPKLTSSLPEKSRREVGRVDIPAISELPDAQCEAALHVALDRIVEVSEEDPLQGLADIIALMQKVNIELYKCYAPTAMQAAQNTAMVAQNAVGGPQVPGLAPNVTKDQMRTIGALGELEESIVKMGVAAVKTRDEIERQKRNARETSIGSDINEEN